MIEVKIPYGENYKLAEAYNWAVETSLADWVLLLDHDVFLRTNPRWYNICKETIKQVEDKNPGLITCVTTNRKGRPQESGWNLNTTDLQRHIEVSTEVFRKNGYKVEKRNYHKVAGFFMLVNRKIAMEIGFRDQGEGIQMIDWDYCQRALNKGYNIYVMTGLYLYHMRNRDHKRKK